MFQENLYNRQDSLNLKSVSHVIIIGVGGIGSWVALFAALSGRIKAITLYDPDKIEMTNLNRTPFRLHDVGKYKTDAITELINERRMSAPLDLVCVKEKFNSDTIDGIKKKNNWSVDSIIDCRDGLFIDDFNKLSMIGPYTKVIKLSYDGLSVTYDSDFLNRKVWGDTVGGYTIDPSFLCPCTFLATMVITDILTSRSSRMYTDNFLKRFLTFNMNNVLENIDNYEILKREKENEKAKKELLNGTGNNSTASNIN